VAALSGPVAPAFYARDVAPEAVIQRGDGGANGWGDIERIRNEVPGEDVASVEDVGPAIAEGGCDSVIAGASSKVVGACTKREGLARRD
jgi:hypothetical protein